VVWCPDWPVTAVAMKDDHPVTAPIAVLAGGAVLACSPRARQEAVHRGLRRREAQARCPGLIVVEHDPARDARAFEPVVAAVAALAPAVAVLRPGACAVAARGPASYFGGERQAAERLVDQVAESCGVECQVGVADGLFAALHAARAGVVVDPGRSAEFLAGLDVAVLERPDLADILRRLGIRTLGAFAGLPEADVLVRFGADAALAHRLARGLDPRPLASRTPPPDLAVSTDLDPPAVRVDAAVFATRTLAEALHRRLAGHGLACTRLLIRAVTEHGEELTREWRHDGVLTTADIADRVRWQLDGWLSGTFRGSRPVRRDIPRVIGGSGGSGEPFDGEPHAGEPGESRAGWRPTSLLGRVDPVRPSAGIVRLCLVPEGVVAQGEIQLGLWGDAGKARERAHRALSRVQGLLGPDTVRTAVPSGGRGPADAVRQVPWGDERVPDRPPDRPWPGKLPPPAPALVFGEPLPARVYGPGANAVAVTGRHTVTAPLCRVAIGGDAAVDVTSWAGPWPVDERWWAPAESRRRARFQVCLADGRALLLALAGGRWWVEAVYD
jgi:protein ImuB